MPVFKHIVGFNIIQIDPHFDWESEGMAGFHALKRRLRHSQKRPITREAFSMSQLLKRMPYLGWQLFKPYG